jgi:hypothetical protein
MVSQNDIMGRPIKKINKPKEYSFNSKTLDYQTDNQAFWR